MNPIASLKRWWAARCARWRERDRIPDWGADLTPAAEKRHAIRQAETLSHQAWLLQQELRLMRVEADQAGRSGRRSGGAGEA